MAGIRFDEDVINRAGWDRVPKDGLSLNVLIIGLDSMSHMMVQRKLPKMYSKLKSMGAHILEGYNIVGDGTPQALIPILTGKEVYHVAITECYFYFFLNRTNRIGTSGY